MIKAIWNTPWTFMRWLRLLIGMYLLVTAYLEWDFMAFIVGGLFTFLALLNQGCGSGSCAVPKK